MGNKQSKKPLQAAAAHPTPLPSLPDPPPQLHNTHHVAVFNHLVRKPQNWPRSADGRAFTCAEVAADVMHSCDYIAHARLYCKRCLRRQLQQRPPQPSPLRPTRVLYAATAGVGDTSSCVDVTAAVSVRVRCNEVARVAARLAAVAWVDLGAGQLCDWAECIVEHVFGRHCRQVEVRRRAV